MKVQDGWYAVAWMNKDPKARQEAKLTAYDKDGKVLTSVTMQL